MGDKRRENQGKQIRERPGNRTFRVSKKLFDTLFDEGLKRQSFIDLLRK